MKGKISLRDFVEDVKAELLEASKSEDPFFELDKVELEVSFVLDTKAKAGAKLLVVDIGGETTATQTHKVKLLLTPILVEEEDDDDLLRPDTTTSSKKKKKKKKKKSRGTKKKRKRGLQLR